MMHEKKESRGSKNRRTIGFIAFATLLLLAAAFYQSFGPPLVAIHGLDLEEVEASATRGVASSPCSSDDCRSASH